MMPKTRTLPECALLLRRVGRRLYRQGHMPATSGNLSLRMDNESCAVTASGRDKGHLRTSDVLRVTFSSRAGDPSGRQPASQPLESLGSSALRPSAESALHTSLYACFPDVGAVFHTHSRAATVLSRLAAASTELWLESYELGKAVRGVTDARTRLRVPIFENDPDVPALAGRVVGELERNAGAPCHGYIIRSHGLYAWGAGWQEAFRHLEALDFMLGCELDLLARAGHDPLVRGR